MNDTRSVTPDFADPSFLKRHILDTVHFYAPRCIDLQNGGYINSFLDNGTICDRETKQLVGMARFIYIFSAALQVGGPAQYRGAAEHGLRFLREYQWDQAHGGYHWTLKGRTPVDKRKFAYGHAFVLLAASTAFKAGIALAGPMIGEVYTVLEEHFWKEKDGLYTDEISADWTELSPYRGQNANMHLCEALMAAYEATGHRRYLDRANTLAHSVMFKLLPQSGGLIWEHYRSDWQIDWNYNKDNTKSEYRPYGYIFGHSIEWSKLLLLLNRHCPQEWLPRQAENLFREALHRGLDLRHGGILFAMSPVDGQIIDADKSYWVMSESLGASALLAAATGRPEYRKFYLDMFAYCWTYLVDHRFGAWYQILDACNRKYSNIKSPPPKTDYHPITNCLTAISAWENAAGWPQ
ncbi:mannose/cellobiose epimerase-like protein (N-acyl-D-glucosamine 2-epimerase family) [Paenibacillus forsythiae]|uniref:Mannose/cellobiose epimerase-like protein (N-acyl-D-glucosamine 2-epimerase family) n=1 Tax=Paenibacillus forsythiae TaxID=365616 RepID=A0ABU3HEL0_9BACL|nr:AGE family epimerase/isomerase [Paenibacillus forsythiae]MDT3428115.1 mannose/cellobiose epimerase-like protein (N-acyl-D-glucosamine 2-epimerase family) [Paenibacillus forsythiae]